MLLLQGLINQQVQSQEPAATIWHVCAWVDEEGEPLMEDLLHPTAQGCVTPQVTPPPNEVTGSSVP